tara:strand:- start:190 stop:372 length:183 start_codon:yes stop_codon:yes gene_type:complete
MSDEGGEQGQGQDELGNMTIAAVEGPNCGPQFPSSDEILYLDNVLAKQVNMLSIQELTRY